MWRYVWSLIVFTSIFYIQYSQFCKRWFCVGFQVLIFRFQFWIYLYIRTYICCLAFFVAESFDFLTLKIWSKHRKCSLNFECSCSCLIKFIIFCLTLRFCFSIHSPYIYGSPYLGAAAAANSQAAGLVPIQATQLTQAAALAAATNQFYEYQVSTFFCQKHVYDFCN